MTTDSTQTAEGKRFLKKMEKVRKAAARACSHRSPLEDRKKRGGPRSRSHK